MSLVDTVVTHPGGFLLTVFSALVAAFTVSHIIRLVTRLRSDRFIEVCEFIVALVLIVLIFESSIRGGMVEGSGPHPLKDEPLFLGGLFFCAMLLSMIVWIVSKRLLR